MENNKVKKYAWGYELLWAKTEHYNGKIIFFEKEKIKTDMVFHKDTTKSIFVNAGVIKITWINTQTGIVYEKEFSEGSTFTIDKLTPFQYESLTPGASMTEVNNMTDDNDVYVLAKNEV